MDTTASSVQFIAPGTKLLYPPKALGSSEDLHASSSLTLDSSSRRQGTSSFHKLVKTLGVELGSRGPPAPPPKAPATKAVKVARRSSLSGFGFGFGATSDLNLVAPAASAVADRYLRRRSSYEPIPTSVADPHVESEGAPHHAEHDHRHIAHMQLTGAAPFRYPAPPPPPRASSEEEYDTHHENDSQSEVLTFDDGSTDDTSESDLRTISSTSTAPMRFHGETETQTETEDEEEDCWDRSPTPMLRSGNEKHFSVPFQSNKALVISPGAEWELTSGALGAVVRDESALGWTGEWNRGDIQDVISSLRELKL